MPLSDARFGDAVDCLPRHCLIPLPEVAPGFGHFPMTAYEGLVIDLLGRGLAVPSHPSACAACGHAIVWHRHRTKLKPCQARAGCTCTDLERKDSSWTTRTLP